MLPLELKAAWRGLARSRSFTAGAILTIALGVGVNAAVFSVVYAVLIHPLAFRDPGRLLQLWETHPEFPTLQLTMPDFRDWRESSKSFDELAAYTLQAMNKVTLLDGPRPEQKQATMTSWRLFGMLGVRPLAGRDFTRDDESRQAHVALISEALWRQHYAADPQIIGKPMRIDKEQFVVIGVVPEGRAVPAWADLWIPLSLAEPGLRDSRQFHPLEVVGRLRPGVSEAQAQAELRGIASRLAAAYPATNGKIGAAAIPLTRQITGEVRPALLAAWGAVALVLFIACANVAHLVLARHAARAREVAVRSALGAGRARVVGHVFSETFLLACAGGALGIALGTAALAVLRRIAPPNIPRFDDVALNLPVLLFSLGATVLCAVVFGLPACWKALRTGVGAALSGGRSVSWRSRGGRMLIAGELALSMVVVAGAALLVRSFATLLAVKPGFESGQVLNVELHLLLADWNRAAEFYDNRLAPALHAIPGVEDVAAANSIPLTLGLTEHSRFATRFAMPGIQYPGGRYPVAQTRWIAGDYFGLLRIPLLGGRFLNSRDRATSHCVINQQFARKFFAGQDPVGRHFLLGVMQGSPQPAEVVGVVGDVHEMGLDEAVPPVFYSWTVSPGVELLIKTSGDPRKLASSITAAIHALNPELAVNRARPLDDVVASSLSRRRFALELMAGFAALALLLAAIGTYGVAAYHAVRRTREFAIRSALGATRGVICAGAVRENAVLMLFGIAIGAFLAGSAATILRSMLFEVRPADPVSLAAAAALLAGLAVGSTLLPVIRALRTEPWTALRED